MVEEIPLDLARKPDGRYTILKVRLRNWDTNRFLVYLSKYLGISKKRITYAGTKDKRGITTQYFCLNHSFDPSTINISDVEVLDSFRTDRMLTLGDLQGNRFTINLRSEKKYDSTIRDTFDEIMSKGGFPNFFGLQRFGTLRTNTHHIGKLIVLGKYEEAAMKYLYDPEFDTEDYRVNFASHNDPRIALKEFPAKLSFERTLLGYLDEHGTLRDAFSALPRNLSLMFVHAYQSYIFNRVLSARIRDLPNPADPQIGDVFVKVDSLFNAIKDDEITVNRLNQSRLSEMALRDELRPTIPLIGYETLLTRGYQGEIEQQIMDEEGIKPAMFRIQGYADLSSKGERRIVSCKPVEFNMRGNGVLEFALGRGIYATSLIREFLKPE